MYNCQVYPGRHSGRLANHPFMVPLKCHMSGSTYLQTLREKLPAFLQTVGDARLVFYNAGTDILDGDPLGMLKVSFQDIVERDCYVLEQLKAQGSAVVVLTSGGYTTDSHRLVAECAKMVLRG